MNRPEDSDPAPTLAADAPGSRGASTWAAAATRAPAVEFVQGGGMSLASETGLLLQSRLKVVAWISLVVCLMNLGRLFLYPQAFFRVRMDVETVRLVFLVVFLGVLHARASLSKPVVEAMKYGIFGAVTLFWMWNQTESLVDCLRRNDIAEMVLANREGAYVLMTMMVIYGVFIPDTGRGTARVVLTMAMAPFLGLAVLQEWHPLEAEKLVTAVTASNAVTNLSILTIGAILAIYGSITLNSLRREVHNAKRYGQYNLVTRLGGGGMGEVFLAEHELLKRPAALKLIRAESATDPTALARFEREVRSTAVLGHPNTVEIYDYGRADDGSFYYVMEYLPGMSLAELVEGHGPLPPERVIFLMRQACGALAEAHAHGLVHRDLKPANLFIAERGGLFDFVKLLDFGLVKQTREAGSMELTGENNVSGTPLYMSPEQTTGSGVDGRTDLYALGAVGYYMLTGRPPFEGETPVAVMIAHARDPVVPPSKIHAGIPEDLERIILRCLEKSPAARFADAESLDDALAACQAAHGWDSRAATAWWQDQLIEPTPLESEPAGA